MPVAAFAKNAGSPHPHSGECGYTERAADQLVTWKVVELPFFNLPEDA